MENVLRKLMIEFCERFNLEFYELPFSKSLSEEELNAFNLYLSEDIQRIIDNCENDYSKIDRKVNSRIKGLSGTGTIGIDSIPRLGEIITKVQNEKEESREINYLRYNKKLFNLLIKVHDKIKNENLIDTIPIPKPESFVRSARAKIFSRFRLGMMIHECIHFILENNGISYSIKGKDMRDEGLCTFLHKRFGKYFIGDKEYEKWAKFFEDYFKNTQDGQIIYSLKKISSNDLLKMMKEHEQTLIFRKR